MRTIASKPIWGPDCIEATDIRRFELTDLIRFRSAWYCGFREGVIHNTHPAGRARIIRSEDGQAWTSVALFTWDRADTREPRLSITADGSLMVNTALSSVDRKGYRQSVTWLSPNGVNWSEPFLCPTGADSWRWDCTWHEGWGYSVGYAGKDQAGTLYRTRDGRAWSPHVTPFFPEGCGNETSIAFDPAGRAIALLRRGPSTATMGISIDADYATWQWRPLEIDWYGDGTVKSADNLLSSPLGGPKLLCLDDGRIVAAARVLGPGDDDGRVGLFILDADKAVLTRFAAIDATSYAGVAAHEGKLWVTCAAPGAKDIRLATLDCPPA